MGHETKNKHAVTTKNPKGAGRPRVGKGNGKALRHAQQYVHNRIMTGPMLPRLFDHIEGNLSPTGKGYKKEMTPSQVTAALSLLDRVAPKISQTELKVESNETQISRIEIVSVAPVSSGEVIEHQDTEDDDNQDGSASG